MYSTGNFQVCQIHWDEFFLVSNQQNACRRIYYSSTHMLFQNQTRAANYDTPWQSLMAWWKRVMSTRLIASTPLQPPCICWEITKRHGLGVKVFCEQSLNRLLPMNYTSPALNLRNKRTPKSKFFWYFGGRACFEDGLTFLVLFSGWSRLPSEALSLLRLWVLLQVLRA